MWRRKGERQESSLRCRREGRESKKESGLTGMAGLFIVNCYQGTNWLWHRALWSWVVAVSGVGKTGAEIWSSKLEREAEVVSEFEFEVAATLLVISR